MTILINSFVGGPYLNKLRMRLFVRATILPILIKQYVWEGPVLEFGVSGQALSHSTCSEKSLRYAGITGQNIQDLALPSPIIF